MATYGGGANAGRWETAWRLAGGRDEQWWGLSENTSLPVSSTSWAN